jgi:indolepyruvate ferredoxin oxidoreductase
VGCQAGVLERNASSAMVIGNLDLAATAEFKRNAALSIDAALHRRTIEKVTDSGRSIWLHGVRLAERLFGNAQAMNTMLLGIAWQRGAVPVGETAILRAIELNGAAVTLNKRAFLWGRILAEQPDLMQQILEGLADGPPADLETLIARRVDSLTSYQSKRYARRYQTRLRDVMTRETAVMGAPGRLSRAVAENLYRVMAYKDEYEVARLHAAATYGEKPAFHMSPPLIAGIDKATGRRRKIAIPGSLALPLFRLLRHGKAVRGSLLDPFGYQAERQQERALIAQYASDIDMVLSGLTAATFDTAVALAELPDQIRGFGPVKDANRTKAQARREQLLQQFTHPAPMPMAAE